MMKGHRFLNKASFENLSNTAKQKAKEINRNSSKEAIQGGGTTCQG